MQGLNAAGQAIAAGTSVAGGATMGGGQYGTTGQTLNGVGTPGTGVFGGIAGAVQAGANAEYNRQIAANNYNSIIDNTQYNIQGYGLKRKSELADLYINNVVQVPTVQIPYNTDILRDFYDNGVLLYRYLYNSADVTRIDKLLTMYGYKHAKALERSDFTNRTYFNFVSCQTVSIGGNPAWINEGAAEQLKAGVRVWHTAPNTSYYTNNPVAS